MIPTRMRRGPPPGRAPRSLRGRSDAAAGSPDDRSVAIAAGDSSPALTGARGPSPKADSGGSPGSDGPSPWAHDYTTLMHSHATSRPPAGATRLFGSRPATIRPSRRGDLRGAVGPLPEEGELAACPRYAMVQLARVSWIAPSDARCTPHVHFGASHASAGPRHPNVASRSVLPASIAHSMCTKARKARIPGTSRRLVRLEFRG